MQRTASDTMERRPLIGVAVVVVKDGRILLGRRRNSHGDGCWQFPGGHLEFNESVEECATRELFEETGIHIKNLRLGPFTNDIFVKEGKHYVTLFVIADHAAGEAVVKEPEKCDQWMWFEPKQLPEPLFLPILNLFKRNYSLDDLITRSNG